MNIKVKVTPHENGNTKGFANVVLDNCFAVNNIKIVEGSKGLFVSMPTYKSGEEYKNICNPITKEFREQLNAAVLDEYQKKISKSVDEAVDLTNQTGISR